jgi:hypothetical protein
MQTMKLIRYNKISVLKRIGPALLDRFLKHFEPEFTRHGLLLPRPDLPEEEYFNRVAHLLNHPDKLPNTLNEALAALEDVGRPEAQDFLTALPNWSEVAERLAPDSTYEEVALQLWLYEPALLVRASNTQRLKRLTAFEHAGRAPDLNAPAMAIDPLSFVPGLTKSLDEWFTLNDRGEDTVRIESYPMGGEFWFLIRHGDRYSRTASINARKTEMILFRPERDDVVVLTPELDELRINARTKGERDLYIRQFGLHLRGSEDYYTRLPTYTLDPLRTAGPDALDPAGCDGISKVRLRELEVWHEEHRIITRSERCLFETAGGERGESPIPLQGELRRAIFAIEFTGSTRPRPVEIRLPNTLKLGRRCDARLVLSYLSAQRFRRGCGVVPPNSPRA